MFSELSSLTRAYIPVTKLYRIFKKKYRNFTKDFFWSSFHLYTVTIVGM